MTHLELLQKLPSPIRGQAIEYCRKYYSDNWFKEVSESKNIQNFLFYDVNWQAGGMRGWWEAIYDQICNGEFDDLSITLPKEDWEELKIILAREVDTHGGSKFAAEIYHSIESQLNNK